ncbi:MAG TPA: dienelactone hydrolase family protein [Phycisphaerae bacterium]|nr:dienelactone hydrolase family protein [Phycisphaerae bacterium]HOJ55693.1 dienelactone hydrolase family protein [Phycisphaerae bacterium]HOL26675.1 dienelactone hydrolase family protein [Phycisphaerae bacterium]HPP20576.1 dienelactone hydrolase family protein [Phycisphaerae bacterium]
MALASVVMAWPGHSWDEWKKVTTWTKPEIKNLQTGRSELLPPLATGADLKGRIDEIRGWEARRAQIAATIQKILGEPSFKEPGASSRPARIEVQNLSEEILPDHLRRHIRIRTEADDWIPACLLIPKDLRKNERYPAMICLHQTVAQGKQEPCGIKGDPELAFALQLVRRGFVCIAPDAIGFGERIPPGTQPYHDAIKFYQRHPKWSFMGKMVWDVSRVVDYLETLDFVNPSQIGSIGHSHGAYGTLFAAAFEPRIAAAIASCGFTPFRSDPTPQRWSHLTALIPQLGTYLPDVNGIPFDWQDVCALIAPRPLFVWYATQDSIFPNTAGLDDLFREVRGVYGLYGAADDLAWKAFDGPHKFPADGRALAYRWLEERFFPVGDVHTVPLSTNEWSGRRETLRRLIRRTIGNPPANPSPPDPRVLTVERLETCERRLIEYTAAPGERVRAYLCAPHDASKSLPGILVLHQTESSGKLESVGLKGDPSLAFAADLAGRGYVTLAPDSIAAGERIGPYGPFDTRGHYRAHPGLSAMGKMLYDAQRALDVLASTEGVDAQRLGAIGHSLGAEEALMLAAFDERVKATVASCGYATFKAEKDRLRWARDHWFSYMPKLRPVFQMGRLPEWDWDDVLRLIAPRGLYQHTTENDPIFTESKSAYQAGEAARAAWRLYDAPADRFINVLRPGGHAISPETKAEIYAWLDRQLR